MSALFDCESGRGRAVRVCGRVARLFARAMCAQHRPHAQTTLHNDGRVHADRERARSEGEPGAEL